MIHAVSPDICPLHNFTYLRFRLSNLLVSRKHKLTVQLFEDDRFKFMKAFDPPGELAEPPE
jgi:hypothetical protein